METTWNLEFEIWPCHSPVWLNLNLFIHKALITGNTYLAPCTFHYLKVCFWRVTQDRTVGRGPHVFDSPGWAEHLPRDRHLYADEETEYQQLSNLLQVPSYQVPESRFDYLTPSPCSSPICTEYCAVHSCKFITEDVLSNFGASLFAQGRASVAPYQP